MCMTEPKSRLSRRTLFAGAGTVGALATVASLLPQRDVPAPAGQEVTPPATPERGGGYRVTEHVQRYYRSARG
jgi:hypothetical protein